MVSTNSTTPPNETSAPPLHDNHNNNNNNTIDSTPSRTTSEPTTNFLESLNDGSNSNSHQHHGIELILDNKNKNNIENVVIPSTLLSSNQNHRHRRRQQQQQQQQQNNQQSNQQQQQQNRHHHRRDDSVLLCLDDSSISVLVPPPPALTQEQEQEQQQQPASFPTMTTSRTTSNATTAIPTNPSPIIVPLVSQENSVSTIDLFTTGSNNSNNNSQPPPSMPIPYNNNTNRIMNRMESFHDNLLFDTNRNTNNNTNNNSSNSISSNNTATPATEAATTTSMNNNADDDDDDTMFEQYFRTTNRVTTSNYSAWDLSFLEMAHNFTSTITGGIIPPPPTTDQQQQQQLTTMNPFEIYQQEQEQNQNDEGTTPVIPIPPKPALKRESSIFLVPPKPALKRESSIGLMNNKPNHIHSRSTTVTFSPVLELPMSKHLLHDQPQRQQQQQPYEENNATNQGMTLMDHPLKRIVQHNHKPSQSPPQQQHEVRQPARPPPLRRHRGRPSMDQDSNTRQSDGGSGRFSTSDSNNGSGSGRGMSMNSNNYRTDSNKSYAYSSPPPPAASDHLYDYDDDHTKQALLTSSIQFRKYDDSLLHRTLGDACRWAYGTVYVEIWIMNLNHTFLFRPDAGWWIDPIYYKKRYSNLCRLFDPHLPDYCPPVPVPPGVGLAGILWSEATSNNSNNNNSTTSRFHLHLPGGGDGNHSGSGGARHKRNRTRNLSLGNMAEIFAIATREPTTTTPTHPTADPTTVVSDNISEKKDPNTSFDDNVNERVHDHEMGTETTETTIPVPTTPQVNHQNHHGGGHHGHKVVWREVKALANDPDQPWNPRLQAIGESELGWAAAVPFSCNTGSSHNNQEHHPCNGIVVYMARDNVDLQRLQSPDNENYLIAAANLAGAAYALRTPRRLVVEHRKSELDDVMRRVRTKIIRIIRSGQNLQQYIEQIRVQNEWVALNESNKKNSTETELFPSLVSPKPHHDLGHHHSHQKMGICGSETLSYMVRYVQQLSHNIGVRTCITLNKCRGGGVQPPPSFTWRQTTLTFVGVLFTMYLVIYFNAHLHTNYGSSSTIPLGQFAGVMALLYGLSAAPASQPRNALCGQFVTMTIATILSNMSFLSLPTRQALSAACSIASMVKLGVMHPPAGASSIMFASTPNLWGSFLFTLIGYCIAIMVATFINNWSNKRQYPNYWGFPPLENICLRIEQQVTILCTRRSRTKKDRKDDTDSSVTSEHHDL